MADWTLYEGDSLEVMRHLPADSFAAVVTDPPYGVGKDDWDAMFAEDFAAFAMRWAAEARRLSPVLATFWAWKRLDVAFSILRPLYGHIHIIPWVKPIGSQYGNQVDGLWSAWEPIIWCSAARDPARKAELARVIREARKRTGMGDGALEIAVRGRKTGLAARWQEGSSFPSAEDAARLAWVLKEPRIIELAGAGRPGDATDALPDYLEHRTANNGRHPCEKPVPLMEDVLRIVAPSGGPIVDPFAGTGATLEAAVNLGYTAVGIERESEYCEIIRGRMAKVQPPLPLGAEV